jgi:hypothetical protein
MRWLLSRAATSEAALTARAAASGDDLRSLRVVNIAQSATVMSGNPEDFEVGGGHDAR